MPIAKSATPVFGNGDCGSRGNRTDSPERLLERAYWALKEGGDASGLLLDVRGFFGGEPPWVSP